MTVFSDRLKELRLMSGEKQSDVAILIGVSVQSYSAYEASREPNYELLCKLAEHYQVSIDYLLGRTNDREPKTNIAIPVVLGEKITASEAEIEEVCQKFFNALGSVVILPEEEKKPFYDLIAMTNTMLEYSRCIGEAKNLMGQSIAIDEFITASLKLSRISVQLAEQAYKKLWELHPEKRPKIRSSGWSTKKPPIKDGSN